ncbi:MAG: Jag N-terminal domain-containing protein [Desulfobacterota bacterium]|nr:Jag N-terminal domain-containing protein [Thermodesulfobacteriota bacterium]
MHTIEVEAKSVKEAIAIACERFHTTEHNLSIEIIQDGSGIFSLFSGKKAKIRATKVAAGSDNHNAAAILRETLERIVRCIDPDASVEMLSRNDGIVLHIVSADNALFIGKQGQTLEAFQYLFNKIKMNRFKDAPHVTIDAGEYRQRHIDSLISMARRLSQRAKQRNSAVSTGPLAPADRRIIHLALKDDENLVTRSKGDGYLRRVTIAPKNTSSFKQRSEP